MHFAHPFFALWIFWGLYWLVSSSGTKRTLHRARSRGRFLALLVFIALLALGHNGRLPWLFVPLYHPSDSLEILGLILCASGIAFAIWARNILGTNWSAQPTLKENHELITTGPYRYVRHPIYTGLLLAILGTVIASGRTFDFIILAYLLIDTHFKAKTEESLMLRQFPDAYPAYRNQTKAIIPYVL
ncbi:MAG: isoprenylcysteine carboxylmethyltransferase family protein [Opitutales bacterium]|jgi:protein-S-isoprenylcysteine O-methyltransferase Ste14